MAYMIHELLNRGGEAEIDVFKGSIATNYGIRRKTQDEYIEDLKYAGMIDVAGNKIFLKWEENEVKEWLERQGFKEVGKQKKKKESLK